MKRRDFKRQFTGQCRRFQVHACTTRQSRQNGQNAHTILIKNVHVSSAIYANCLCARLCLAFAILTVIRCRVYFQLRVHSVRLIFGMHKFDQVPVCFLAVQPLQPLVTWKLRGSHCRRPVLLGISDTNMDIRCVTEFRRGAPQINAGQLSAMRFPGNLNCKIFLEHFGFMCADERQMGMDGVVSVVA